MTLGLLCGSGKFRAPVCDDLVRARVHHTVFSVIQEATDFDSIRISATNPEAAAKTIRDQGVDRIIHLGTFRTLRTKLAALAGLSTADVPTTRSVLSKWEEMLRDVGVSPIWIWEQTALHKYQVGQGVLGKVEPPTSWAPPSSRALRNICSYIRSRTLSTEGGAYGYSQAVVLEDDRIVAFASENGQFEDTDMLLKRVRHMQQGGERSLVKVFAPGVPARLDPPTIGRDTIEYAFDANVRAVAVDERGVFIAREEALQLADSSGIAVIGFAAGEVTY